MCDLIALGFQTDKTRIATLLLCRDISGLFYPFLDVRAAHHGASHDDKSDGYQRVTQFYVEPARLPRLAPRRHARGRRHGARQHLPAVHQQPVVGHQARRDQGARRPGRRPRGDARRPAACSTTATRATSTASSAACTSGSWTGWASSSTASATPPFASSGSDPVGPVWGERFLPLIHSSSGAPPPPPAGGYARATVHRAFFLVYQHLNVIFTLISGSFTRLLDVDSLARLDSATSSLV